MQPHSLTPSKHWYLNLIFGENCLQNDLFTGRSLLGVLVQQTTLTGLPMKNKRLQRGSRRGVKQAPGWQRNGLIDLSQADSGIALANVTVLPLTPGPEPYGEIWPGNLRQIPRCFEKHGSERHEKNRFTLRRTVLPSRHRT
jgi:hypothetical protein